MVSLKWELLKKSYPWRQESRVNHNGTAGHSVPRYYTTYERWAASLPHNQVKKDESLRNFHWCLIRTLHNYPFSTDWKSISVFLSMYKQEINTRSWFLFPDIFKVYPMIFYRWYDMRSIRKNARKLCWLGMAPEPKLGHGLDDQTKFRNMPVF